MSIKFYPNWSPVLTLIIINHVIFIRDLRGNSLDGAKFVGVFNKKERRRTLISAVVLSDDDDADWGSHVGNRPVAGCRR